jgi:amidophosphoribosyltransferase
LGDRLDANALGQILQRRMRVEKIITKDVKQRTFITQDSARVGTVSRVYDTVYGIIRPGQDTLVLLDDSIVRGTTLRESLIRMLARLRPKKVIVVSSAPQIRYPDCYGIDMSKFKDLIAFNALVEILKDRGQDYLIDQTYAQARYQLTLPKEQITNTVQELYGNVSEEEVSQKIAQMLTPPGMPFEVQVIYQSLEGLQRACPQHSGDWCFSGNFPTQGGMRVVNRAFINYKDGVDARAY